MPDSERVLYNTTVGRTGPGRQPLVFNGIHHMPRPDRPLPTGGEAAAEGAPAEEKSVLEALQDLHSHFGHDGAGPQAVGTPAPTAAAAAPGGDADGEEAPEPPRQRIGKVRVLLAEIQMQQRCHIYI